MIGSKIQGTVTGRDGETGARKQCQISQNCGRDYKTVIELARRFWTAFSGELKYSHFITIHPDSMLEVETQQRGLSLS